MLIYNNKMEHKVTTTIVTKEKFKTEAEPSRFATSPKFVSSPPGPVNGPDVMISESVPSPGPVNGPDVMISESVPSPGSVNGPDVMISVVVVSESIFSVVVVSRTVVVSGPGPEVVPVVASVPAGGDVVLSEHPDPDPSPEPSPDIHPVEPSVVISGRGTSTRSKY